MNPWADFDRWLANMHTTMGAHLAAVDQLTQQAFALAPPLGTGGDPRIEDDGDVLVVHLDLPGIDPQRLQVHTGTDVLHVRGVAHQSQRQEQPGLLATASGWSSVARTVPLPVPIDAQRATAAYNGDVLTVRAPKLRSLPVTGA